MYLHLGTSYLLPEGINLYSGYNTWEGSDTVFFACPRVACSKMTWGVLGGVDMPIIFPAILTSLSISDFNLTVRFPNQLVIPYLTIDSILALSDRQTWYEAVHIYPFVSYPVLCTDSHLVESWRHYLLFLNLQNTLHPL